MPVSITQQLARLARRRDVTRRTRDLGYKFTYKGSWGAKRYLTHPGQLALGNAGVLTEYVSDETVVYLRRLSKLQILLSFHLIYCKTLPVSSFMEYGADVTLFYHLIYLFIIIILYK